MTGKIISIVGGPGCGKSYLVKRLSSHYNGVAILEGEERDFPREIVRYMSERKNNAELFVWFRNKLIREMLKAKSLASRGKIIVTDNYWLSNEAYIDPFFTGFEKKIFKEMSLIDRDYIPHPDIIIYMHASTENMRKMIRKRGRKFDQGAQWLAWAKTIDAAHRRMFTKKKFKNLIILNRDGMDFDDPADLKKLTSMIDALMVDNK